MKKFKGKKGALTFSPQDGKPGHCICAQVFDKDKSLTVIEPTEDQGEATRYAKLFHAAPNILEALQGLLKKIEYPQRSLSDRDGEMIAKPSPEIIEKCLQAIEEAL